MFLNYALKLVLYYTVDRLLRNMKVRKHDYLAIVQTRVINVQTRSVVLKRCLVS